MIVRRIIERRAKTVTRQGIYIGCAVISVFFGLLAFGMQGGTTVALPYLLVIGLCVTQLVRPTLLGWSLVTAAFGAYTVGLAANARPPYHDFVLLLLVTGLPTALLLLAWPKPLGEEGKTVRE